MPDAFRTCVLTIAAENYRHYVRVLMDSVAEHVPGADRVLGLCDQPRETVTGAAFSIVPLDRLGLPDPERFLFRYTLLELSTAIKPFLIRHLMREQGYDRVIYFDPDIRLYASMASIHDRLDHHPLILTPHLTAPLEDDEHPSEQDFLRSGANNLGFVALRRCEAIDGLLDWWADRLTHGCVVDPAGGVFVDQKWMDLAPGFVEGTWIERDPGWNVAYWNLPHRTVDRSSDGTVTVEGRPLRFFHFSGLDPDANIYSKHQSRYDLASLPTTVRQLVAAYVDELRRRGYPDTSRHPHALATFADGTPIPEGARRIYRENEASLGPRFPDPGGRDAAAFIAYLNEPAVIRGAPSRWLTRLTVDLHRHGPDVGLAEQFPDLGGENGRGFATWLLEADPDLVRLAPVFLDPIRRALATPDATGQKVDAGAGGLARRVYHLAWAYRHWTHRLLPLSVRQRIHALLFRSAYARPAQRSLSATGTRRPSGPPGINLVGYLSAELGVGEAARSTLRAAKAVGLPVTPVAFTLGITSRSEEAVASVPSDEATHPVTLLHINADQTPYAVAEFGPAWFRDRLTIGYWNWELPTFPEAWRSSFQHLDEIWAPSAFCQQAFADASPVPVCRIPCGIPWHDDTPPRVSRADLGLPENRFLFLFVFDALSVVERKNPLGLIQAYRTARSGGGRSTALVIKAINGRDDDPAMRALREEAAVDPDIVLLETYLDRPALSSLFGHAGAYVSLHRSEGFGLTLAEAMAMGLPTLATGWSGNTDFMRPGNAFLVPYTLQELDRTYGPYREGDVWADPDLEAAAALMVRIAEDPEAAQGIADEGRATIRREFSPAAVGQRMLQRLRVHGVDLEATRRPPG